MIGRHIVKIYDNLKLLCRSGSERERRMRKEEEEEEGGKRKEKNYFIGK